jgi:hypothetical protein
LIAVERWGPYGSEWINDVEDQTERRRLALSMIHWDTMMTCGR